MDKEKRQAQIIELLSAEPWRKNKLIKHLGISERTLWRDKRDLEAKGYLIQIADLCELKSKNYRHETVEPASNKDIRWLAILKLVAEAAITRDEIKAKIAFNEGCSETTVGKDINELIEKKYLTIKGKKLFLGEAMLNGLDLSQEEGSRLLSYLVIKQEIEGQNPLHNSLIPSFINLVGKKNNWLSWQNAKRITQKIVIKGANTKQELRERAMAERLELASWEEQLVELKYKGELRQVEPLGVIYSYHQDAWYLHAYCRSAEARRTFRLEHIEEFQVLEEKFSYPAAFDLEENFNFSWGIMVDEPPIQVRIKFYDDYNVISRLQREVAERRRAKIIPQKDGSVIYEDWVVGMEELKVWVRSFGSSAEILEPTELRENLLASVEAALALYGEVGK